MSERPKWQPPTEESEEPRVYTEREETESCNKGSHKKRSEGNDERPTGHRWFWKKEEKKKKKEKDDEGN